MSGHTGWHGLQTDTEKKMLCLMCNGGDTYYIDFEPNCAGSDVAYAFTKHFDLASLLHPLQKLDAALPDS